MVEQKQDFLDEEESDESKTDKPDEKNDGKNNS